MPSTGPLRWKEVKPLLDDLLPGWTMKTTTHSRLVRCTSIRSEWFRLPRGSHGSKVPEIRLGDLRRLLRFFGREAEGKLLFRKLR